jgi:CMP-N-acetylneuraminic acid synthetase
MSLRVLGVITARGGSKGIPRKNIKDLCGKPLISWTIEAAKASKLLADCIVSTDDQEIADVAKAWGGRVPFMRPADLANDTAKSIPVGVHALDWLKEHEGKEFDALMFLQPTSPLRVAEDIDASIRLMDETGADSVMGMGKLVNFTTANLKRIDTDGRISSAMDEEGKDTQRRQEQKDMYKRNGAIYLTKVGFLRDGDLFGRDSRAWVMPPERSVDIDTPLDFALAELMMKEQLAKASA